MCGVNGMITKKSRLNILERIEKMNTSLIHRGPDAGRAMVLEEGMVALGHRRLSIIDLDKRSTQPMMSNSARWILSYNGEIYNYKLLRKRTNYQYRTQSDTEVILAYLETYGIDEFLKCCNGMFAFAAYDTVEKKMYICRDRLGIKPLYYYIDHEHLIFSSEIKGILNSGLVEAILDEESIDDYLGYRYVREPYTFFKNIKQLEAGHYIQIDLNLNSYKKMYWDLPKEFNLCEAYDEETIKLEFKERLEEAVLRRTVSDVSLGTYLSGGIDSSVLSAIVAKNTKQRINTYTIGFPELNEFNYSQMVAKQYHTIHHEILLSQKDYLNQMQEIICYKDAPLGIPNEVPLAMMSRELKKEITVVLSGEGADELMGGYGKIFRTPFEYENTEQKVSFYDFLISRYEYVPRKMRNNVLNVSTERREEYDSFISRDFTNHTNEYNVFKMFHKYHIKGLLQRVDTTTMLASVEARVPFLDHELIEYVYREIPYNLKLRWKNKSALEQAKSMSARDYSEILDYPKYLLKEVAADYIPHEVIARKKMGFPVPLNRWNKSLINLVNEKLVRADWIKVNSVKDVIEQCQEYTNGDQLLWMFLNVQMFIESYFNKEWRY